MLPELKSTGINGAGSSLYKSMSPLMFYQKFFFIKESFFVWLHSCLSIQYLTFVKWKVCDSWRAIVKAKNPIHISLFGGAAKQNDRRTVVQPPTGSILLWSKKVNVRTKHYWEWYGVFNPYILIDNPGYDGNHINGIIDLTEKWIGVKQSFLLWALWARWKYYNIDE